MSTQEANTIWIKAYTPNGTQVGITIGFESGKLIPASDIDAMVAAAGYSVTLPGAQPGEVIETITHVMRRTRHADDGRVIPIVAFYIDNLKFKGKYDHIYMDDDKEIADFEAWSGLKLSDIPEFDGEQFIERDNNPKAKRYIVALPEPRQVAAAMGTWKNPRTGETGETMKIKRLLGVIPSAAKPSNIIDMPTGSEFTPETAKAFSDYWQSQGVSATQVLGILGVSRLGEWKKSIDDANELLSQRTG